MRMRIQKKLLIAAAALIPALMACPAETPPDPVTPKPAKVKSFSAAPAQVALRGELATLSWDVEDATSITIATAAGQPVPVEDPSQNQGTVQVKVDETTVYLLTARGEGGTDAAATSVLAPDNLPQVLFSAFPDTVPAGHPVTLVWNAPGAGDIAIADGAGNPVHSGTESQGSVTVTPAFDTRYTLDADGRTFEVAVTVTPAIAELTASPTAVEPGGTVTVHWKAGGATKVVLSAVGRGELAQIADPGQIAEGSFSETLPAEVIANGFVTYVLEAQRDAIVARRELKVWVGTNPLIEEFLVPAFAQENGTFSVYWRTQLASQVQIAVDDEVVYQVPTLAEARTSTLTLPSPGPGASVEIELRARNDRGGLATRAYTVASVGSPALVEFSASTNLIAQGGDVVTLSWQVTHGRNVRVATLGGRTIHQVSGLAAESGAIQVYPNTLTDYVLHADNGVGETISIQPTVTVDVTTPAQLTWSQGPVPAGAPLEVTGHTVTGGGTILGLPHVAKNVPGEAFIDISQTGTRIELFAESWGDMPQFVSLTQPFDATVYGVNSLETSLSVAVEGWLAFAPDLIWGDVDNTRAWPGKGLAPLAIAPYFDNLAAKQDGSSRLYHRLDGKGLDQRLIVQWSHVEHAAMPGSDLTFQAQLYASGKIVFAYQTLQGVAGELPSVGVINRDQTGGVVPQELPAEGDTFTFFGELTPPVSVEASPHPWFVRVRIDADHVIELVDSPDVIPAGQLSISEMNVNPTVANGQWFEVRNNTANAFDLTGWELDFNGVAHPIAGSPVIPASSTVLFAQTPDAGDGLTVGYTWGTAVALPQGGTLGLKFRGGTYSTLSLPPVSRAAGVSWHLGAAAPGMTTAPGASEFACAAPATAGYGTHGQTGTPGGANSPCPNYAAPALIAGNFESIAATGTQLSFSAHSPWFDPNDEGLAMVTLPAPIVLDGISYAEFVVGTNGFISLDTSLQCSDADACFNSNKFEINPTTGPVGLIAPYWDDLASNFSGGVYVQRKVPGLAPNDGYTLISWEDQMRLPPPIFGGGSEDLNFQVKFFDTGTVEFHYGQNSTDGFSSTTWFEHPTGSAAFVINAESSLDGVGANVGYRFVAQ